MKYGKWLYWLDLRVNYILSCDKLSSLNSEYEFKTYIEIFQLSSYCINKLLKRVKRMNKFLPGSNSNFLMIPISKETELQAILSSRMR